MAADVWYLEAGIAAALVGGLIGLLVPALIARVPEPEPEKAPEEASAEAPPGQQGATTLEPKELYSSVAALRGLRWKAAVATGVVAGSLGARVGWVPELSFLLFLAPVGVALAVIDWRTRLLPTKLIAPSYLVVIALVLVVSAISADWDALGAAALGWLIAGGTFFLLWFVYPAGLGYGDVRLSGVLGIVLGYLGWSELLTGVYLGFLLGGVGGFALAALRIVDRKAYPFGPFMLVGAWAGVLVAPYVVAWYA